MLCSVKSGGASIDTQRMLLTGRPPNSNYPFKNKKEKLPNQNKPYKATSAFSASYLALSAAAMRLKGSFSSTDKLSHRFLQ